MNHEGWQKGMDTVVFISLKNMDSYFISNVINIGFISYDILR